MLQKLRERMGREEGFTLIELLVVMLILGILAAIAIPTFFNQREKAQDSDSKAMAKTAQTAIETYAVDHNGTYAGADRPALQAIEAAVDNTVTTVTPNGTAGYTLTVTNPDTTHTFTIVRNGGTFNFTCTPATGAGGCPNGGQWD